MNYQERGGGGGVKGIHTEADRQEGREAKRGSTSVGTAFIFQREGQGTERETEREGERKWEGRQSVYYLRAFDWWCGSWGVVMVIEQATDTCL